MKIAVISSFFPNCLQFIFLLIQLDKSLWKEAKCNILSFQMYFYPGVRAVTTGHLRRGWMGKQWSSPEPTPVSAKKQPGIWQEEVQSSQFRFYASLCFVVSNFYTVTFTEHSTMLQGFKPFHCLVMEANLKC